MLLVSRRLRAVNHTAAIQPSTRAIVANATLDVNIIEIVVLIMRQRAKSRRLANIMDVAVSLLITPVSATACVKVMGHVVLITVRFARSRKIVSSMGAAHTLQIMRVSAMRTVQNMGLVVQITTKFVNNKRIAKLMDAAASRHSMLVSAMRTVQNTTRAVLTIIKFVRAAGLAANHPQMAKQTNRRVANSMDVVVIRKSMLANATSIVQSTNRVVQIGKMFVPFPHSILIQRASYKR